MGFTCQRCKVLKNGEEFSRAYTICKLCWQSIINIWRKNKRKNAVIQNGGHCSCCGLSTLEFLRYSIRFKKVLCFNCLQGFLIYKLCPHTWTYWREDQVDAMVQSMLEYSKEM